MLDVHPPHHSMGGFREFLLHLLTITIGLLIALGLEAGVEAWHHRNLRHEAEANLRLELQNNIREIDRAHALKAEEDNELKTVIDFLDSPAHDMSGVKRSGLGFSASQLTDASSRTAVSTGAVSYMDYPEVQRISSAYVVQELYLNVQRETLDDFLQLQSHMAYKFDPAKMSPAATETALTDARRAMAHLEAMDQIGASLQKEYAKVFP